MKSCMPSDETIKKVMDMLKINKSLKDIGKETGLSLASLQRYRHKDMSPEARSKRLSKRGRRCRLTTQQLIEFKDWLAKREPDRPTEPPVDQKKLFVVSKESFVDQKASQSVKPKPIVTRKAHRLQTSPLKRSDQEKKKRFLEVPLSSPLSSPTCSSDSPLSSPSFDIGTLDISDTKEHPANCLDVDLSSSFSALPHISSSRKKRTGRRYGIKNTSRSEMQKYLLETTGIYFSKNGIGDVLRRFESGEALACLASPKLFCNDSDKTPDGFPVETRTADRQPHEQDLCDPFNEIASRTLKKDLEDQSVAPSLPKTCTRKRESGEEPKASKDDVEKVGAKNLDLMKKEKSKPHIFIEDNRAEKKGLKKPFVRRSGRVIRKPVPFGEQEADRSMIRQNNQKRERDERVEKNEKGPSIGGEKETGTKGPKTLEEKKRKRKIKTLKREEKDDGNKKYEEDGQCSKDGEEAGSQILATIKNNGCVIGSLQNCVQTAKKSLMEKKWFSGVTTPLDPLLQETKETKEQSEKNENDEKKETEGTKETREEDEEEICVTEDDMKRFVDLFFDERNSDIIVPFLFTSSSLDGCGLVGQGLKKTKNDENDEGSTSIIENAVTKKRSLRIRSRVMKQASSSTKTQKRLETDFRFPWDPLDS